MKTAKSIFIMLKPYLIMGTVVLILQITGQLGTVITFGQTAVLKTGILNAGAEQDEEEDAPFDYSFTATDVNGNALAPDSLKNKVVFLNIWATWCGPCRAEMPTIQKLYESVKNPNVVFVMLSVDRKEPDTKVRAFLAKNTYTFPVYILRGAPTTQLRVANIPTTYIIAKSGKIIRKEVGMRNYDTDRFRKFLLKEAKK